MLKYFIIYLIAINLIAFLAMYIDKRRAKYGKWRIPEQTLFILALIGGSIGAIAGMYTFRHKTKKLRFSVGFPVILVLQIILIVSVWNDFLKISYIGQENVRRWWYFDYLVESAPYFNNNIKIIRK